MVLILCMDTHIHVCGTCNEATVGKGRQEYFFVTSSILPVEFVAREGIKEHAVLPLDQYLGCNLRDSE